MLIIAYFFIFVLLLSLIILLPRYFNALSKTKNISSPKESRFAQTEFSEELITNYPSRGEVSLDYSWKGNLIDQSPEHQLPQSYNGNTLVLIVKNTHHLYAYWEINTDSFKEDLLLRVYEINLPEPKTEMNFLFDIKIYHELHNCFFQVPNDNCTYCVEIGRLKADGTFDCFLRSNLVQTPRSSLSTAIDENWLPYDLLRHIEGISPGFSGNLLSKRPERMNK